MDPAAAGRAVVEGILLASYRYVGLKTGDDVASKLRAVTLVAGAKRAKGVAAGACIDAGRLSPLVTAGGKHYSSRRRIPVAAGGCG